MQIQEQMLVDGIRMLSAQAIQKANSGHPGMPLGAAPLAYALWGREMCHDPAHPDWANRDRFVLSAGHGSMMLYALQHIFGYGLTMEDIQAFRQWDSRTPGHPEYGVSPGVECTSGPLGQGIAMAVGMAMAEAKLAAEFNQPDCEVVDHYTYALCGDGCMMEGVAAEASSLAGTLGLGKLIVLYDKNDITIEGSTDLAFTEDVGARYAAYGWQVLQVADGNDVDAVALNIRLAKACTDRPSLIICRTQIGYGSPKQGSAACHGSPLGDEGIKTLADRLGWTAPAFTLPQEVYDVAAKANAKNAATQAGWQQTFAAYREKYPQLAAKWDAWMGGAVAASAFDDAAYAAVECGKATRVSSGALLNQLFAHLPNLFGGSADLAPSNNTVLKAGSDFAATNRAGSNVHFGVREFGMAAIANGIALHGGLRPFVATFFVFSDYLKPALRMAALMGLPVLYILTHDSIGVGEDGPTHQPVEQLAALRSLPNCATFRPADARETLAAYEYALTAAQGPVALVLTRQGVPGCEGSGKGALRGGYVLSDCEGQPAVILIASGSEVQLALQAKATLAERGVAARVVSLPCMELFDAQDAAYKEAVLPAAVMARVAVEAGSSFGWHKYVGLAGATVCIDHFGASAPAKVLFEEFGFTAKAVVQAALDVLQ